MSSSAPDESFIPTPLRGKYTNGSRNDSESPFQFAFNEFTKRSKLIEELNIKEDAIGKLKDEMSKLSTQLLDLKRDQLCDRAFSGEFDTLYFENLDNKVTEKIESDNYWQADEIRWKLQEIDEQFELSQDKQKHLLNTANKEINSWISTTNQIKLQTQHQHDIQDEKEDNDIILNNNDSSDRNDIATCTVINVNNDKNFNYSWQDSFKQCINLENIQSERMIKQFSKDVRKVIKTKLTLENEIKQMKKEFDEKEKALKLCKENIPNAKQEMKNELDKLSQACKNYHQSIMTVKQLLFEEMTNENEMKSLQSRLKANQLCLEETNQLLIKYNGFSDETKDCMQSLNEWKQNKINEFEQNWSYWSYQDILFWFQIQLKYFEKRPIIWNNNNNNNDQNKNQIDNEIENNDASNKENVNNGNNNNYNNENEEREEKEALILLSNIEKNNGDDDDDVLAIDFLKVFNNLKSQKINGKLLKLLNKSDLRNMGFESFEHQCILYKSIENICEKYPSHYYTDGEIEGTLGQYQTAMNENDTSTIGGSNDIDNTVKNEKYICAITNKIMKEPVIAYDGITYEKQAIIEYIKQHKKTPNSDEMLNDEEIEIKLQMLFQDYELKNQIQAMQADDQ